MAIEIADADKSPSIHVMIDSSPQGGVDWLNSEFMLVRAADVCDWHEVLVRSGSLSTAPKPRSDTKNWRAMKQS